MKLNHLILVICTGILVGFSACKKDPFTEADAIAAQKELITMKYGYELQLKNIEAAIQKAHDDAQILMKNLEIKGASDLSKQEAAQSIAYLMAALERDKQWYAWYNTWITKFNDSVNAANQAKADAAAIAAAWNALATTYNVALRILDNNKAVAGATIKILNFDGATFFTATSDANGYIYIKNQKFLSDAPLSIVLPNSANAVYPIYYGTPANTLTSSQTNLAINSYDPTTLKSISGTVYAALDLTNNAREGAGAGVLVSADAKILSANVNTLTGKKDTVTLSFPTSTLASGAYSLKVPVTGGALASYTLSIPDYFIGYQRAYTLVGSNPYQAIPTKSDSVKVVLGTSGNNTSNTTWNTSRFFASYFMTLPDSDGEGGYSATLTDPIGILVSMLQTIDLGGSNTPEGVSAPDSSIVGEWSINPAGFLLNNGHLGTNITNDEYITYKRPKEGFSKDSTWKDTNNLNPDSTTYDPLGSGYSSKYFTLNEWLALSVADRTAIMAARVANGNTTFTPTTLNSDLYGNDTLAIELVDLTGILVNEAPELIAVVEGPVDEEFGSVTQILLLEDASHGMFNITAVLDLNGTAIDSNWFTNYGGRLSGQVTVSGTTDAVDYLRSGYTITSNKTLVNWNYGALYSSVLYPWPAKGVKVVGTTFGQQSIPGTAATYIIP